jgi:hypothetical protein
MPSIACCAAAGLQEVHFSGGKSERLSSLRHEKRYKVPESPLLQVSCQALCLTRGCPAVDQGLTRV